MLASCWLEFKLFQRILLHMSILLVLKPYVLSFETSCISAMLLVAALKIAKKQMTLTLEIG